MNSKILINQHTKPEVEVIVEVRMFTPLLKTKLNHKEKIWQREAKIKAILIEEEEISEVEVMIEAAEEEEAAEEMIEAEDS